MPLPSLNRQPRPNFSQTTSIHVFFTERMGERDRRGRPDTYLFPSRQRNVAMSGPAPADKTRAARDRDRGLRSARRRESRDNRVYSRLMYYLWALVCRWSCARGRLQAQASTVTGKQRYSSVDKHVSDKRVIVLPLNHLRTRTALRRSPPHYHCLCLCLSL